MIVFLVVSGSCLVKYGLSPAWVLVCSLAGLYYGALVLVCSKHLLCPGPPSSLFRKVYNWCRTWLPSQVSKKHITLKITGHKSIQPQVFGTFLLALPVISLYS